MSTNIQTIEHYQGCALSVNNPTKIMFFFSSFINYFKYRVRDAEAIYEKACLNNCPYLQFGLCDGDIRRILTRQNSRNCLKGYSYNSNDVKVETFTPIKVPPHIMKIDSYAGNVYFFFIYRDFFMFPYKIANIYSDGRWCKGSVSVNLNDPLDVYTGFFSSEKNPDLSISDLPFDAWFQAISNDPNHFIKAIQDYGVQGEYLGNLKKSGSSNREEYYLISRDSLISHEDTRWKVLGSDEDKPLLSSVIKEACPYHDELLKQNLFTIDTLDKILV